MFTRLASRDNSSAPRVHRWPQDPYDYAREDQLLAHWRNGDVAAIHAMEWPAPPGFGHFYYGHAVNPGDGMDPNSRHQGSYEISTASRDGNAGYTKLQQQQSRQSKL